jgi:hypothetical protein
MVAVGDTVKTNIEKDAYLGDLPYCSICNGSKGMIINVPSPYSFFTTPSSRVWVYSKSFPCKEHDITIQRDGISCFFNKRNLARCRMILTEKTLECFK